VPSTSAAWAFLPWGYLLTVLIETPVLLIGLSPRFSWRDRLIAGLWLTACTYPIVVLVLPPLVWQSFGRTWYLVVAETFAPVAECLLLRAAYGRASDVKTALRDYGVVITANLLSFGLGEIFYYVSRN
jgi:hypothetical protein